MPSVAIPRAGPLNFEKRRAWMWSILRSRSSSGRCLSKVTFPSSLYALESSFYVPLNTRLRGSIVREILDACLTVRDAKPLQFPGIFVRKTDIERVPTDTFLYLSLTKRMIVEENPGKWKI